MIQIYNKETQSYETWGNKRSPITSNTASSGGVDGLKNGYVLCSKNYPIPPMGTSVSPHFGTRDSIGRTTKVYELQEFADSIILYKKDNTPENSTIQSTIQNNKLASSIKEEASKKELNISSSGYEIKIWLENQYDSGTMSVNDFNVVTLNEDNNGNDINFQTVDPPTEPISLQSKIAFNDLGNVSNASTYIELAVKDPKKTSQSTSGDFNNINLTRIKIQYANVDDVNTIDESSWNNVSKIYWNNTNNYSSNSSSFQSKLLSSSNFSNGIHVIDRVNDHSSIDDSNTPTIRYYYIKIDSQFLSTITNYDVNSKFIFRVSYKNASNDNFGLFKESNVISISKPNKPTITSVIMTSYNKFTITLESFNDKDDIIGDTDNTSIINNNMGVFLRNINFNVAYQYSDETSQSNITTFTEIEGGETSKTTSTNTSVYINTTSFGSSTYTYTLPAGFYPSSSTNTNPITYYFSASVQNNLISTYSKVSDQQSIQITKPNSSMTITLTPQTSGSSYNNKILATFTAPSNGDRGIVSAQADNGLPKLQKYTFKSTNLKIVDSDTAVEHHNSNASNRNADPSTERMLTFYDSLKGSTGSVTENLDLEVREYNEYVNNYTQVSASVSATATKPELVTINDHSNLVISKTTSKNTVKLNWAHPTNRGLTIDGNNIRNTILTYRINIERDSTTNKYLINNNNQTDTTYETTTTQSDTSNDKTGITDATNTKTLTSDNDDSLLWPNSTYNYTVRATNSLGYQSDAQTSDAQTIKGTFTTGTPTIPTEFNYFKDDRLNSLHPSSTVITDLNDNNNYVNLGILISGSISSSTTYSGTAVQITNYNNLSDITSSTVTHVLNKKSLQTFLTNTKVQLWSTSVPTDANQAGFKIVNAAKSDTVLYTIGMSTNHTTETDDDTVFQIIRSNRKDIYSETYDDRNIGYWLKESIKYKINLSTKTNLSGYLHEPLKFELKSYYNTNGSDTSISTNETGKTVILENSHSSNGGNVYLDILNNNPSIGKNNDNNYIIYTVNNYINGVPNIYPLNSTAPVYNKLSLTYRVDDYSTYYLLNKSSNLFYYTISNTETNSELGHKKWSDFGDSAPTGIFTRNNNHWIISNHEFDFKSTSSSSRADLQLTINATNTKGNNTHKVVDGVCEFIYDKESVDLINELKKASEAAHSISSSSSSTQNGQIMEVPSTFNPNELSSATTQGADFNDTVFNEFSSNYNSKQLILFNGKFSTPQYLYDSNETFYNALHGNKDTYGITKTFNDNSDTSYSWVIYKFIRKYTGSGTQNLNWFVLSFNENSNITSTDLENGYAQIWIQTKLTPNGSSYTTHTYTANPADGAPGSLKWINYKPSGANTTQSVAATLGPGADLGANNDSSSFDQIGSVGASGINISGTTYSSKKRNLVGVINNVSKISSSGNIIYYIAVGLKNNKSLWVSKPASFDAFLPDKNISR